MKSLFLMSILVFTFALGGCAMRRDDIVEEQREELGIEDEGFYEDEGLYDDPDGLYEDPGLID